MTKAELLAKLATLPDDANLELVDLLVNAQPPATKLVWQADDCLALVAHDANPT